MQNLLVLKTIILGVVEGVTEFLPISSTGHLIIVGNLLHIPGESTKVFNIFIQLGAVLSILVIYKNRLLKILQNESMFIKVLLAFLPSAFVGYLCGNKIRDYLFNSNLVALSLIGGGILMMIAERKLEKNTKLYPLKMTKFDSFKIGLMQCFALIPGVSRSAATIIGGMFLGLDRKESTQFSFLLAIPTLTAASLYCLISEWDSLSITDSYFFTIGFISAFISALICVKWFISFVSRRNFKPFARYRISLGMILILRNLFLKILY